MPRTVPGGRPIRRAGDVGPEGHPPFVGRIFRACAMPGTTGPVLRPSRHALQHTMPESGRAPGPPGSFSVTTEKSCVCSRSLLRNSPGVPHPGTFPHPRQRHSLFPTPLPYAYMICKPDRYSIYLCWIRLPKGARFVHFVTVSATSATLCCHWLDWWA